MKTRYDLGLADGGSTSVQIKKMAFYYLNAQSPARFLWKSHESKQKALPL